MLKHLLVVAAVVVLILLGLLGVLLTVDPPLYDVSDDD